ncbi:MAG: delta-lactam-biosynthetic de-N-acetylase [Lachnospiraceae bacterium]|nr:delta-lactam-biosynthetic de-N-acetylase [Lachnospiraceae bacterium]
MTKLKKTNVLLAIILAFVIAFTNAPTEVYAASLSNKALNWGYTKSKSHKTPAVSTTTKGLLEKYDGYYVYNTKKKYIYLTFDLGYDNGYTNQILDVLKDHDIQATFFVCKAAITANPKAIKRMVKEGHIVANHTVKHIPFYKQSKSSLKEELEGVEKAYEKVTGEKMAKFVRPPEGGYSERALAYTQELGYTSIFWSIALPNDWNLKNQPSKKTTLDLFKNQHHRGAIVLLHGVSPMVADNLDAMLTQLEKEDYEFRLVSDMAKVEETKVEETESKK